MCKVSFTFNRNEDVKHMDKLKADSNGFTTNSHCSDIKKSNIRNFYWAALWLASTFLASFGPRMIWEYATVPTVIAVILNLTIGTLMLLHTTRHIKKTDELAQKVFYESTAVTLGAVLVFSVSYELLEKIQIMSEQPEVGLVVLMIGLTFIASNLILMRKYR